MTSTIVEGATQTVEPLTDFLSSKGLAVGCIFPGVGLRVSPFAIEMDFLDVLINRLRPDSVGKCVGVPSVGYCVGPAFDGSAVGSIEGCRSVGVGLFVSSDVGSAEGSFEGSAEGSVDGC